MRNRTEKRVVDIEGFYVTNVHFDSITQTFFFVILNFVNNMFPFVSPILALLLHSRRILYFPHSRSYGALRDRSREDPK